jgi:hypothetical protein
VASGWPRPQAEQQLHVAQAVSTHFADNFRDPTAPA